MSHFALLPSRRSLFSVLTTAALAHCCFAQSQPLSLNLTSAFADTKAAMLAGDGDIVCMGDSLTARDGAYFRYFSRRMRAEYGDGGEGFRAFVPWTGVRFDPGWFFGSINGDDWPYYSLDGMYGAVLEYRQTLAISPGYASTARMYYHQRPTGGSFSIERPNQPNVYIGTDFPTNGVGIVELASEVRPQALFVRPFAGFPPNDLEQVGPPGERPVAYNGFAIFGTNWISDQPGVRVHRAANGGWGVDNFLRRNSTFDSILQDINPDMYIIMLGQNDGRYSASAYAQRMGLLVDRLNAISPNAEIVLIASYDSNFELVRQTGLGVRQLAQQRGLGFIDMHRAAGSHASLLERGFLDPDRLHFSPAGGRHIANIIYDALQTGGASLEARCNDMDFNNDNIFPTDQDVIEFFNVLAGAPCSTAVGEGPGCDSVDFDRNTIYPDDADITAFLNVLAGAPCD
jgi:lysophospholipase L1-like esterase